MNNTQANKLNMYESMYKTLQDNQSLWNGIQAFAEAVNEFGALLPQIRTLSAQRIITTSGLTQMKAQKKENMAKQAVTLANVAMAYAARQKNDALKTTLDFSFSEINKSKDNTAIEMSTAIYTQINAILPELNSYGVAAGDMNALHTAIQDFQQVIGDKGNRLSGGVADTQALVRLFEEADAILKDRIDKFMFRFQDSNARFFDTYTNARVVKDLGKSHKVAKQEKI